MINQNYEKLMKMNLTKMAELYKNQSTNKTYLELLIISGSSTTQFTTSAPVVDNRSTISANK